MSENILDDDHLLGPNASRRDLLPMWIKVFVWIFLIFGALVPVALILGVAGVNFSLSLYGLETIDSLSLIGVSIMCLFIFKGIVAFGLWTEKEWAVSLAIADASIGIILCILAMAGILDFSSSEEEMCFIMATLIYAK